MKLSAEQTGPASMLIRHGSETVCEIRDLRLCNVRLSPRGGCVIGEDVSLPLYWEQYANHQDPDRNAGSGAAVRVVRSSDQALEVVCTGRNASSAVSSRYLLTIRVTDPPPAYQYDITAEMMVAPGRLWRVTPNRDHGEVEFCNFWPEGAFAADADRRLRYDGCYRITQREIVRIPHHHVESSDKHNIRLRGGDRLAWFLEDENPCITLLSHDEVAAGVCAYMWDAHLAYRVCADETEVLLPGGTTFAATFRLSGIDREEGGRLRQLATQASSIEHDRTPAIVDGVHDSWVTCSSHPGSGADVWPWETEVVTGNPAGVLFAIDREVGRDDASSVRISSTNSARARWKATAIGPAFRQASFPDGARYRMVAFVRTAMAEGSAGIGMCLHRTGAPGLFDAGSYESFHAGTRVGGTSGWTRVEVKTPPVSPAPDRVHLILDFDGIGTCWFDNVHFTREE